MTNYICSYAYYDKSNWILSQWMDEEENSLYLKHFGVKRVRRVVFLLPVSEASGMWYVWKLRKRSNLLIFLSHILSVFLWQRRNGFVQEAGLRNLQLVSGSTIDFLGGIWEVA